MLEHPEILSLFEGTPDSTVIRKIGSPKAQAYVRSLPVKKAVPFQKLMPLADPQGQTLKVEEVSDGLAYFTLQLWVFLAKCSLSTQVRGL